ncbi:hypothetical protein QP794_19235 [Paenibacillus sp. UMB7766-LJ446]|uniref:hypothetical protein n=1 Tax=Paenibacillus sp. UMB7766-LJ446 TaxID=3046313 RepID=UPI00254E4556|nr:hypothetical protein [Paenibacillus sp. UMB7766-LJ446]MDK8192228.1 hypothetical protein [Paenibacillus sp. UMB7766-LJ446]
MSESLGIIEKYDREINDIGYKLKNLENGRYYENSGAQMDGYLATNIQQLRKMIAELISKIDNQSPSRTEELLEALGKIDRP